MQDLTPEQRDRRADLASGPEQRAPARPWTPDWGVAPPAGLTRAEARTNNSGPHRLVRAPAGQRAAPPSVAPARAEGACEMDETKLQEFMGRLVVDMGGAAIMANVILGEELGLYRAMADGEPVTPEQLAERTRCNARLVREWLSAQAASGYVEHDKGRFRLPEEQAMALAVEDSPVYVAGGASVLSSMYFDKDKLVAAMRGDGALSWADHHPCLFAGSHSATRWAR